MNLGIALILKKLGSLFFTKKRIVGWIAAVVLAAAAVSSGMSIEDLKAAIADAPVLAPVTESK